MYTVAMYIIMYVHILNTHNNNSSSWMKRKIIQCVIFEISSAVTVVKPDNIDLHIRISAVATL